MPCIWLVIEGFVQAIGVSPLIAIIAMLDLPEWIALVLRPALWHTDQHSGSRALRLFVREVTLNVSTHLQINSTFGEKSIGF